MAFNNYLLKVNGNIFPLKYIKVETYKITPNQTQDENSYEDGNGKLHRDILPHKRTKLEFTTPHIHEADNRIIQALFPDTVTVNVEYWNPRKGVYESGTCYTPDLDFDIYKVYPTDIIYGPLRLAFIEY